MNVLSLEMAKGAAQQSLKFFPSTLTFFASCCLFCTRGACFFNACPPALGFTFVVVTLAAYVRGNPESPPKLKP